MTNGTITPEGMEQFTKLAAQQGHPGADLAAFGTQYVDALSQSYNYGFASPASR